jgi:SAM-dependent methyltransferase
MPLRHRIAHLLIHPYQSLNFCFGGYKLSMTSRSSCICSAPLVRQKFSENFDALDCPSCGSRHFTSADNGLPAREYDYDGGNEKYARQDYLYGKQLRWAHKELLKQDWTNRKVLEIGCFNGFFLDELRKIGADTYGFDVNLDALEVGTKLFALDGKLDNSMERLARQGPFDDVICIDVLEHLDAPESVMGDIAAMLNPDGRIFVAGPTIERPFRDKTDFPPHHKWWFSRNGLRRCLQQQGFKVSAILIQRDALLFVRNFIGRAIHGLRRREYYGDTIVAGPQMDSGLGGLFYSIATAVGTALFSILRVYYCSTIVVGTKSGTAPRF